MLSVFLMLFLVNIFVFYEIASDDLEDIRKEIEREEEQVHIGPLKTRSELSMQVLVVMYFL